MEKKNWKKVIRVLEILLFAVYLILLCYFLFFADRMEMAFADRTYHYNLMPLKEIKRFWIHRHMLDFWSVFLNLVGNVVAFIPFGILLPRLFQKCRSFLLTMLFSFEFSLCVEIIQLVGKVGSFDVDDILLNTCGGVVGFLIYRSSLWLKRAVFGKKSSMEDKHEKKEPL